MSLFRGMASAYHKQMILGRSALKSTQRFGRYHAGFPIRPEIFAVIGQRDQPDAPQPVFKLRTYQSAAVLRGISVCRRKRTKLNGTHVVLKDSIAHARECTTSR